MINKVDGQHNYTNAYERQKRKAGRVEADAPAFLLDYDEKGVVWERSSEQKKGQVPKESVSSGNKKELKKEPKKEQKQPTAQQEESAPEEKASGGGDFFKKVVQKLRGLVQGFLQLVWYSQEEETEASSESTENGRSPGKKTATEETDNAPKAARNTTVLTGYDRRGRLVKPDEAEAGRLLHPEQGGSKTSVEVHGQGTYRKYI